MRLNTTFYKKNPSYDSNDIDSEYIVGEELLYMQQAYFIEWFFELEDFEYVDVKKDDFYNMLLFIKDWRKCFDNGDFSNYENMRLLLNSDENSEFKKNLLDEYINKIEEVYNTFDWDNDTLTIFTSR